MIICFFLANQPIISLVYIVVKNRTIIIAFFFCIVILYLVLI